jgi:hypothetical protein
MSQDEALWTRARQARDKLVDRYLAHPDVTLIGIGHAPEGGEQAGQLVLRIHVRERWMNAKPEDRVAFPEQVDGIPVVVLPGEYRFG